jgi:BON domain
MADRWREERERRYPSRDREPDDYRYAGETILGRADWGDRESDYEHGFRPMSRAGGRDVERPDSRSAERYSAPRRAEGSRGPESWRRDEDRDRLAGETALGRADWGDRESDYEHGLRPFREGRWPAAAASQIWRAPEQGPYVGRAPRGYQRSDQRIFEDVCDRLTADPHVDPTEVDVRVENGEVTLSGAVRSREEKHRAEDVIESIGGVRDVHNHLRVSHGGIGERGAPQTPLGISSPGGESRRVTKK